MLQSSGICLLSNMGFAQSSMELFAMVGLFKPSPPHPPPSFDLYPLPYFFLLVNAYSGFSILIAPENVQPKSSCGLCFVHVSRKTFFSGLLFLHSNKECGETENLILLLYGERSHKEHPILPSSTAFNAFKEGRPFEPF